LKRSTRIRSHLGLSHGIPNSRNGCGQSSNRQAAVDAFVAAAHSDVERAQHLLEQWPGFAGSASSWGESGVQAASHSGRHRLTQTLLEHGAAYDVFVASSLGDMTWAVAQLERLGTHRCGVHGLPVLHFAIVSGCVRTLEALLAAGAPANPAGCALPPLHSAVAEGRIEMVRLILLAGADPLATDSFGETALDWAVSLDGYGSALARTLARAGSGSQRMG